MKNRFAAAVSLSCLLGIGSFAAGPKPSKLADQSPGAVRPALTDAEKHDGWKLLFDGVSTEGWRGLGMDHFPADLWTVENGSLHCLGGKKINDLVTLDAYENFELSFEWMLPKPPRDGKEGGNSGVKYRVQEKKGEGFA